MPMHKKHRERQEDQTDMGKRQQTQGKKEAAQAGTMTPTWFIIFISYIE